MNGAGHGQSLSWIVNTDPIAVRAPSEIPLALDAHEHIIAKLECQGLLYKDNKLPRSNETRFLQRMGPVAALPALLTEYKSDPEAIFAAVGLSAADAAPDARAPFSTLVALLDHAAAAVKHPHLGLLLGLRNDHRTLGAIGDLMMSAPHLEAAFQDYIRLQMTYSRSATVFMQQAGEDTILGYGIYCGASRGTRQLYDMCIAIGCNMIAGLTNGLARPSEVHISAAPPADVGPYRRLLQAPVLFNQAHTCLVVPNAAMKTPLPSSDPIKYAALRAKLIEATRDQLDDTPARVRHILRPLLMMGACSVEDVAREIAMHPRTLGRHLAKEGLTFEKIKDEVRCAVALELLEHTDMPVGAIGDALSYASHSAFVHAFQRWMNVSPSKWRKSVQAK